MINKHSKRAATTPSMIVMSESFTAEKNKFRENLGTPKKGFLRAEAHRKSARDGRRLTRDTKGSHLAQKVVAKVAKVRKRALSTR